MRILEHGLTASILVLLSGIVVDSASLLSSCTHQKLKIKVPDMANAVFDAAFNGDEVALLCSEANEPVNSSAKAVCEEGNWKVPADFQCMKSGFCKMFIKSSPTIKIVRPSGGSQYMKAHNIFQHDEKASVHCRHEQTGRTYTCKNGKWDSYESIICKTVACPAPPLLENGRITLQSTEVAEPLCSEGFNLKGSTSLYCSNGTWQEKKNHSWPVCERIEVVKTFRNPLEKLEWIGLLVGVLMLIGVGVSMIVCYVRKESPKRNRLMHNPSNVDELLHLRRTKPIVIPDPVSHTQVHYTHDRKPVPVTSL